MPSASVQVQNTNVDNKSESSFESQRDPTVLCTCDSLEDWCVNNPDLKGFLWKKNWDTSGERFRELVNTLSLQSQRQGERCFKSEVHAHIGSESRTDEELRSYFEPYIRAMIDGIMAPEIAQHMHSVRRELATLVFRDALEVACHLAKHVETEEIIFKLETIGSNRCSRWHRDWYIGRAICTYSGVGTEYQDDQNVDFDKFSHRDFDVNQDCVLDTKHTQQARTGDVLYMKGMINRTPGLVHRSPEPEVSPNGAVLNRLCLKVDIPRGGRCSG